MHDRRHVGEGLQFGQRRARARRASAGEDCGGALVINHAGLRQPTASEYPSQVVSIRRDLCQMYLCQLIYSTGDMWNLAGMAQTPRIRGCGERGGFSSMLSPQWGLGSRLLIVWPPKPRRPDRGVNGGSQALSAAE